MNDWKGAVWRGISVDEGCFVLFEFAGDRFPRAALDMPDAHEANPR